MKNDFIYIIIMFRKMMVMIDNSSNKFMEMLWMSLIKKKGL